MIPIQQTIADIAQARALATPSMCAFSSESAQTTYAEILASSRNLAGSLAAMGLGPGDVIAFQLPNWVEAVVVNIASSLLGAVCVPIVTIYRGNELRSILADCHADAIFCPAEYRGFDFAAMFTRIAPQLRDLKHLILVRDPELGRKLHTGSDTHLQVTHFETLVSTAAPASFRASPVDLDDPKVIMYTSGTTGTAKGVVHNHRTMTRVMQVSAEHWGIGAGDTILMPSPVTHTTGYANGMEMPFAIGTHTLLMERWDAKSAVDLIDSHGVAMMIGATPFLHELLTEARAQGSRLPSLRIFACGGASIPADLIHRANEWFENAKVFRVYGSTESPLVTLGFLSEDQRALAADTDGEFIDYQVKITDEKGRTLAEGEDGEICVRGPCLFAKYTDETATRDSFDGEGFFLTGDIGHVTRDHAIVVTDRKKDLIIRGGEKLSAREVEEALLSHPRITDVAAVRMPHARLGETICLYAVVTAGPALLLENIHEHMTGQGFAKQKFPERLEIVDSLPRTPSGKVRKDELRTRILKTIEAEKQ
jgi:cyclohexanecarboxylate-CoA ligase